MSHRVGALSNQRARKAYSPSLRWVCTAPQLFAQRAREGVNRSGAWGLRFSIILKSRLFDETAELFDMVENKLFLSLAHQKTAEVLEKTFICTRCVEGFKESQGLTESVLYRNFIISEIFFNRNSGSYLVDSRGPLILQRWVWNFDWKKTSETADRKNRRNSRERITLCIDHIRPCP